MTTPSIDRSGDDVGNIVAFEHVNLLVPDFEMATVFYVNGLGLTRDPYIDLGPELMWINAGAQQFHLPKGDPQVIRGTIDLRVPDLGALRDRLERVSATLAQTQFSFSVRADDVVVRGPWGNEFRCRPARPGARLPVALESVTFPVREGAAAGIERFYRQVMGTQTHLGPRECLVVAGPLQALRFVETAAPIVDYDGHHVAVYLATVSTAHRWLVERQLVVEESDDHQFRFTAIVDPETGEQLFELEHEVRSLHHRLYGRPLVNRNPDQRLPGYVPGADPLLPASSTPVPAIEPGRDPLTLMG